MSDGSGNPGDLSDEMAEYLQTYLDETEEQLDDLVETMLSLERDPTRQEDLNEAFRLVHSIKGSAGMMGFDKITVLTHHLENRFARFRSGQAQLDEPTMNLVLRCVDYLRNCNRRLRDGEQLASPAELLDELRLLEEQAAESPAKPPHSPQEAPGQAAASAPPAPPLAEDQSGLRMTVRFRAGLPLVDLKARLIVSRLGDLGEVTATSPELNQISDAEPLERFELRIDTHESLERLRAAADVEGVESIEFGSSEPPATGVAGPDVADDEGAVTESPTMVERATVPPDAGSPKTSDKLGPDRLAAPDVPAEARGDREPESEPGSTEEVERRAAPPPAAKVAETVRVDIDRLDKLMSLTGELVVNRAHFVQVSTQLSPALRQAGVINRLRDFSDSLQRAIEAMESADATADWSLQIEQLRTGLTLLEEQTRLWEHGRRCLGQMGEAIDQLSRVSRSLQRGVLDTRMVPVGPLFNRFKRVVRDLSSSRGKKVKLLIRGEKTELDKRMIDELGDPLVHLVRNSIDHGLESPEVRRQRGKAEIGTIVLSASHSGNNVYIQVRDDGGGIDVEKIKAKLVDHGILAESAVRDLSDPQAIEFIWHPGFSTAREVTDVSGRGVGMDAVKNRINQLNGTIEIDSRPGEGTSFTIRLPLTLAIVDGLLVRVRNVVFSMPMDDVREIVAVGPKDVICVHGKQAIDVRGEFLPLAGIDEVFQWHGVDYGYARTQQREPAELARQTVKVVILQAGGKAMGLRVDELLGSQDIVIKSLAENFISIRGLSGASVLGDGSVCLMLDVESVIDSVTAPPLAEATRIEAN